MNMHMRGGIRVVSDEEIVVWFDDGILRSYRARRRADGTFFPVDEHGDALLLKPITLDEARAIERAAPT